MKSLISTAAIAFLVAATAAPAGAVTFAQFSGGGANNFAYTTTVAGGVTTAALTTGATTGGTFVPGAVTVQFSFTNLGHNLDPAVNNVNALFTYNASTSQHASSAFGGTQLGEAITSGSFSFVSTAPIIVGATTYAAGSNLLSGAFTDGFLVSGAGSSSGSITASSGSGGLVLASDFVTFPLNAVEGASLTLSALSPSAQLVNNYFKSFKASLATGSFDSAPNVLPNGVPEPASWAMLLVGFGAVGALMRRRERLAV